LAGGCGDPVRTTVQPVLLKVTKTLSGEPMADVQVAVKYDYEHNVPTAEQRPEAERPTYKWFSTKTNVSGQAELEIAWTMLDRTWGPTPPPWRDQVTEIAYLIRLKKDQLYEEYSLVMRSGESVRGEVFTVQVLEIRQPRYVKTDQ